MNFDLPRDKAAFLDHPDWEFTLTHNGYPFMAEMQEIDGLRDEDELPFFKRTIASMLDRYEEALRLAADTFFEEFNAKWNQEHPISRDAFISKLRISGISIDRHQCASLEFTDDDDMFWGHAIIVQFNREGAIYDIELAG